jgi:uncharacterized integral membrane protein
MKIRVRAVVIAVLAVLSIVIVVQNVESVYVRILFWDLVISRVVLLAVSVAVGAIIGFLLGRPWHKRGEEYARSKPSPGAES